MRVLVTGGTKGIGLKIVETFLKHPDATIHFTGRDAAAGNEIVARDSRLHFHCLDTSKRESIDQLYKEVGPIDVLILNAGIVRDTLFLRMKDEDFDAVLKTNLYSPFWITKAFLPDMLKKHHGSIVFISSVSARGNAGQANYAASKAGIEGMAKSLALEVGKRNIRVNVVRPGFTDTNMTVDLSETVKEEIFKHIPLARIAQPDEIADVVYRVAVDFSYVTGQVLTVDGGLTLH
ncbi:MAG: SDR family NAD(P)-dependent oxidoreductase [Chlamydiia bacterium]